MVNWTEHCKDETLDTAYEEIYLLGPGNFQFKLLYKTTLPQTAICH